MSSQTDANDTLLSLAVCRIYHEDMLLAQRTYNFLMMQAVLVAALTFSSSGTPPGPQEQTSVLPKFFPWIIAFLGLLLALLQAAFGRRSHAAIGFWRTYLHKIEGDRKVSFDSLQTRFFQDKKAALPDGSYIEYLGDKSIYKTFPWTWIHGANVLVGVLIPTLVVAFWLLFIWFLVFDISSRSSVCAFTIFGHPLEVRYLVTGVVALVEILLGWRCLRPWPPARSKWKAKED